MQPEDGDESSLDVMNGVSRTPLANLPDKRRFGLAVIAAIVLTFVGSLVVFSGPLVHLALGGCVIAMLAAARWPTSAVIGGLGLYYLTLSMFVRPSTTAVIAGGATSRAALDPRYAVVFFVLLLALARKPRSSVRVRVWYSGLVRPLGALLTYGALSLLWSQGRADTIAWTGGMSLALLFIAVTVQRIPNTILLQCLRVFCIMGLVGCLFFTLFIPSSMVGQRAAGMFGNPNSLGLFVVLSLPLLVRGKRQTVIVIAVALFLVYRSGSRASGIALGLELIYLAYTALPRRSIGITVLAMSPVLAVSAALIVHSQLGSPTAVTNSDPGSILRTSDSRLDAWRTARQESRSTPLAGVGMGAGRVEVANSYLQLLYEAGWIGTIIGFSVLVGLGRLALTGGPPAIALLLGSLSNALFESWLFAGGSLFFVLLWLTIISLSARPNVDGLSSRVRPGSLLRAPSPLASS